MDYRTRGRHRLAQTFRLAEEGLWITLLVPPRKSGAVSVGGAISCAVCVTRRFEFKATKAKGAWVEPGPSPLRRRCLSAVSDPLLDPAFHLFCYPRYSASSKPHPWRELAGGFESRDVSETVWNAIDRFELLLRYQLPCHRKSLVKGTLQRPG